MPFLLSAFLFVVFLSTFGASTLLFGIWLSSESAMRRCGDRRASNLTFNIDDIGVCLSKADAHVGQVMIHHEGSIRWPLARRDMNQVLASMEELPRSFFASYR